MKPLTTAQKFLLDLGQLMLGGRRDYKAPHAYRGTPTKLRIAREARFAVAWDDADRVTAVRRPRLFKGQRP